MPSYEYSCEPCGASQVETFSIELELPPPSCPNCSKPMTRVFSPPVIKFNGNGWGADPKKERN
jgi:putative FmdB family regulatory protein